MSGSPVHRILLLGLLPLLVPCTVLGQVARRESPPHWVISTHDCDQRIDGWCDRACPRIFFRPGDGTLREMKMADFAACLRPGAPVVFFVHGSFLGWESALDRAADTFSWLERHRCCEAKPHYVAFAWPSDPITRILPGVDVNILGRRATLNGYYLAKVVNDLPQNTPISMIGHSHGTRVAAGSLQVLGGGELYDHLIPRQHLQPRRVRAVFAASAMDRHWMYVGERDAASWRAADGLVHLMNPEDDALNLYPLRKPFAKRALGQVGFDARNLRCLGESANGLVELNVSTLIGNKHTWNHYTDRPEIARYLAPYVFHTVPTVTRSNVVETPPSHTMARPPR